MLLQERIEKLIVGKASRVSFQCEIVLEKGEFAKFYCTIY